MKKFSYSLDGVLRVRHIEEDQTRGKIGTAYGLRKSIKENMEKLSSEIGASKDRLPQSGRVDIRDFVQTENYQSGLRLKIGALEEKQKELDVQIEQLKLELKQRILETKKLETHKENEKTRWRQESLREEQAEFDEIATGRFGRR